MTKVETSYRPTLIPEQVDALVQGRCQDVFSVLGLHSNQDGKGLVVRALIPWAVSVAVVACDSGRTIAKLNRVHEDGLFETIMARRKNLFDYYFRVDTGSGVVNLEDPYRFPSCMDDGDFYYFNEGTEEAAWRYMGAHQRTVAGVDGVLFAVWAPCASLVSVVGEFNGWDGRRHVMRKHIAAGVWELFVPALENYTLYKYEITDAQGQKLPLRSDPYANSMQHPPETASRVVFESGFDWRDQQWIQQRAARQNTGQAVAIYEVHAGSWRRKKDQGNRYFSYLELADELIPYVVDMGFTHIQLMPISEYPFDGSWGYQPVGMFTPSIRFGTPDEFREFVDRCHQHDIGVLLDWVPGHFPTDEHGLGKFDGSCLYEHEDVSKGFHPDWNTLIYNYGRGEVISYLLSNANYWLDQFHLDGLRVDAVASMLYLDYSRKEGEWISNEQGGRENLEAIHVLKTVNSRVKATNPGVIMIAEESTAWPGVSRPSEEGGLGFDYKWNMGWMNDSLAYMERDPIHRQYHHDQMTFGIVYAYSENFILPLSHDEVVHGKGSLLEKMPGDEWQQFANLRAYLAFMWTHPGKKLLFMGGEFAQRKEWNHDTGLDWQLLEHESHRGVQTLVRDLNQVYRRIPALYEQDCASPGFEWIQADNHRQSVFAWLRRSSDGASVVLVVANMAPTTHGDYRVGVPFPGRYIERLNTDSQLYGGSNVGNTGGVNAEHHSVNDQPCSIRMAVPPLATVVFEWQGDD